MAYTTHDRVPTCVLRCLKKQPVYLVIIYRYNNLKSSQQNYRNLTFHSLLVLMHFDPSNDTMLNKQQIQDSACQCFRHLRQERFNATIISITPAKISAMFSKNGPTPLLFLTSPSLHATATAMPRFCQRLRSPTRELVRSYHL